jgi:hypothetical protein
MLVYPMGPWDWPDPKFVGQSMHRVQFPPYAEAAMSLPGARSGP